MNEKQKKLRAAFDEVFGFYPVVDDWPDVQFGTYDISTFFDKANRLLADPMPREELKAKVKMAVSDAIKDELGLDLGWVDGRFAYAAVWLMFEAILDGRKIE